MAKKKTDALTKIKKKVPPAKRSNTGAKTIDITPNKKPRPLSLQQDEFAKQYVLNRGNATKAAEIAYPNIKTESARSTMGGKLVRNGEVQKKIQEYRNSIEDATGISKTLMINELLDLAQGNVPLITSKEEYDKLSDSIKKVIKDIEMVDRGTPLHPKRSFKVSGHSKLECYELIAKLMGYIDDKQPTVIFQQNNLFTDSNDDFRSAM